MIFRRVYMIQQIVGWIALIGVTVAAWRLSETKPNFIRRNKISESNK